jgi:histidinol dehydrogenase
MTAIFAQTAGVPRICVASPKPSIEILGCAHLLGITEFYRVGGAQAIAAMALGTATIPRVDRIVGPGNTYVAAAKKLLAGEVGIDFLAGPTEILILAATGDAKTIAADMLAQAEHDPSASATLITTSIALAESVATEIERQLGDLPTANIARQSIDNASVILVVPDMDVAVDYCNQIAPEHLSLHDPSLLPKIRNAGTVFLGPNSPESAGDYASGPSHVLPTGGAARLRGGLSTADFVKVIAIQSLTPAALSEMAPSIAALARAEGLEAHARAVEVRCAV